jgi:hypothetical protein
MKSLGCLLVLALAQLAPAQSVTLGATYLPEGAEGRSVDFTFNNLPPGVDTVQVNVFPPGVTDAAKSVYVYIVLSPGTSTYSRTAQGLGIGAPGTYVIGIATYPAGDPIGVGPLGKGLYTLTVLPSDFGKVTATVASQVGAQMVMVTNPYDFDVTANVQVTYKYDSGLPGPAAPNGIEPACACQNPYVIPAGKTKATAALAGLVGAGSYQVTLTINPPADAPSDPARTPTSIQAANVPSMPQAVPIVENNCTASTSGNTRTLMVSASTSTFEIDSITVSHPNASSQITGGSQTLNIGAAFTSFMGQPSGGRASPVYGTFVIALPLTTPSVGTLGASQVKMHNSKGDSTTVTCQ